MGEKAAMNYFNGIMDAVETLAQMPAIGRVDTKFSKGKTIYYSTNGKTPSFKNGVISNGSMSPGAPRLTVQLQSLRNLN